MYLGSSSSSAKVSMKFLHFSVHDQQQRIEQVSRTAARMRPRGVPISFEGATGGAAIVTARSKRENDGSVSPHTPSQPSQLETHANVPTRQRYGRQKETPPAPDTGKNQGSTQLLSKLARRWQAAGESISLGYPSPAEALRPPFPSPVPPLCAPLFVSCWILRSPWRTPDENPAASRRAIPTINPKRAALAIPVGARARTLVGGVG